MNTQKLKTAYKKACVAERLLNEIKNLVAENGGIREPMYIVHDAISNVEGLIDCIKQAYTDTIEE